MKKHIFTNTLAQASLTEQANHAKSVLQEVCDTYAQLDLGAFTLEDLYGTSQARSSSNTGCKSCQGVLAYRHTQGFIEDKLLEAAESNMSIAGVKLSSQKLKSMLELPEESAISAFDLALKTWKSRYHNTYIAAVLTIDNGRVTINENLEKQQKALEFNATTQEGIQLLEDLETLAALLDSVNTRLKHYHQKPLPIPKDGNEDPLHGYVVFSNDNTQYKTKVNFPLVARFLK